MMDPDEILDLDLDSIILYKTDSPHEVEVGNNFDSTLSTAFAAAGGLLIGYDFGFINGFTRSRFFIDAFDSHGKASVSQNNIATMMSLLFCGAFVGSVSGGFLGDRMGRKWLIQLGYIVYTLGVSWQMALNPQKDSFVMILVGRFIIGVGTGLNSVGTVLYMTETCRSCLRGPMLAMYQGYVALGIFFATSITYAADRFTGVSAYRWALACQLIWPVCMAICVYFRPESPRHLVYKGRNEDAYRSLVRLRNPDPQCKLDVHRVGTELTEIYLSHEPDLAPAIPSLRNMIVEWLRARKGGISSESGIRVHPLTVGITLQLMYHCTGIFFIAFSTPLVADSEDFPSNPITIALLFSTILLCGTPVYMWISKNLGHRLTLIIGALSLSVCHLITAITSINGNVDHKGLAVDYYQLILIFFALFLGSSSWAPVMWIIVGEISSMATRCRNTGISLGTYWFCAAVTAAATPYIMEVEWSGRFGIFLVFSCLCICCSLFVYLFVPETNGVFLEYIQLMIQESDPRTTRKWRPDGTFGWWKDRRTDVQCCRIPKTRKSLST